MIDIPVAGLAESFEGNLDNKCYEYQSSDLSFKANYFYLGRNILKCTLSGYYTLKPALECLSYFHEVLGKLRAETQSPFYLVVDMRNLKGADKESREYLRVEILDLFDKQTIRAGAVILPNPLIRTIGIIWSKLYSQLKYTFHKNEFDAYQTMIDLQLQDEIDYIYNEHPGGIRSRLNQALKSGFLAVGKHRMGIVQKKEWTYRGSNNSTDCYLVNGNIIYNLSSGPTDYNQNQANQQIIRNIINTSGKEKLYLIIDARNVGLIPISIRRDTIKADVEFSQFIHTKYLIANATLKSMIRIVRFIHPRFVRNLILVDSIEDAIRMIMEKIPVGMIDSSARLDYTQDDLKTMSKNQLIFQILQNQQNRKERLDELFDIFSRITWDTSYVPHKIELSEKDPFYDLFNAVNLLQDDLYTNIEELRVLNNQLESKVRERTRQLQRQNNELQKVNKELDSFVYRVSHDLRAPLSSLLGLVQLIKITVNEKQQQQFIDLMPKAIQRLDHFIQEIIELSRNTRLAVEENEICFRELVQSIFAELNYMEKASSVQYFLNIHQNVDLISDEKRIRIIFRNLISNAIKYSSPDKRKAKVTFNFYVLPDKVNMVIKDNGQGIPEEYQLKVFDMFFRATESGAGSGLGLYIVKETIDKLKGSIHLKSKPNFGTTIIIRLPNLLKKKSNN
jgi:signal transduction histidine kinase